MKRILLISFIVLATALNAEAQWYLFPGKKNKKQKEEKATEAPVVPQVPVREPSLEIIDTTAISIDIEDTKTGFDFYCEMPSVFNLSLVLPFKSDSETPSDNYLEMYSGALLAVREFADSGLKIKLNTVDASSEIDYTLLEESDLIIGPIAQDQILSTLNYLNSNKVIVSPLDPSNSILCESARVVQSPTTWEAQVDELALWIEEEITSLDELIVLRDSTAALDSYKVNYMLDALRNRNLRFRELRRVGELTMNKLMNYRIVIASESEAYLTGAVRSVALEAARKNAGGITLYATARARRNISSNVSDLHDASARITAAYQIDYEREDVKNFVIQYRSLFNKEPGSFAFQGYDLIRYYLGAYSKYGKYWYMKLEEYPMLGLQSDFLFSNSVSNGMQNIAVRRVVYGPDLSISVE